MAPFFVAARDPNESPIFILIATSSTIPATAVGVTERDVGQSNGTSACFSCDDVTHLVDGPMRVRSREVNWLAVVTILDKNTYSLVQFDIGSNSFDCMKVALA